MGQSAATKIFCGRRKRGAGSGGRDRPQAAEDVNVTFDTGAEGTKLPDYLKAKFPDEMTIILQYEFDRLNVKDDRFDVVLRFKGRAEKLVVPFGAIREFWDRTELKCSAK